MTLPKTVALVSLFLCLSFEAATWISLGVFSTRERAMAFAEAKGATILDEPVVGGGYRYRVVLGPYASRNAALEPLAEQRIKHPDAWLIERGGEVAMNSPGPPSRAVRQEPKPGQPVSERNHEDDEAPQGYGIHELRRSEDRRE